MGFSNPLVGSQITASISGGSLAISGGSLGITGPTGLTSPILADVLAQVVNPVANPWNSGTLNLTDEYEAIGVLVSSLTLRLFTVDVSFAGLFPRQFELYGANEFGWCFLPAPSAASITVNVAWSGPGTTGEIIVYGLRRVPPGLRFDGRLPPIGAHAAAINNVASSNPNFIAAPGSGLRLMLKSITLLSAGGASGGQSFTTISGQIQGAAALLAAVSGNNTMNDSLFCDWPDGVLLDPVTPLAINIGGTTPGTGAFGAILYDIVN